ncbi:MAG: 2-C-methyl-D-erythritol 4-phosphate cytidylyltransferase [Deltaproteobacteria bacterium]|jgi:2-C-methyl-D-erythritol 4-phosphate cytidylyltransferase/2-C-methyl-D-erythritol 2,4-cyclodiphosphate synthase|nr:2-C-methyl-D-erythritol 4-phosphate cytidylyltransferase [Deltaproteobacteria bacterium]
MPWGTDVFASAVIVAAGRGLRYGHGQGDRPKQLMPLGRGTVLARTVAAFRACPWVGETIVVAPPEMADVFGGLAGLPGEVRIVPGGPDRCDSARLGLEAASPEAAVVLVHDGVRPLVAPDQILRVAEAALQDGAAILAVPVRDTLKLSDGQGNVARTIDRANLWQAQTPQGLRADVVRLVLDGPWAPGVTDESGLAEALGLKVRLVEGSPSNLKITGPEDMAMARTLMGPGGLRVGQGWDFHRISPGRPLWLGCVHFPGEPGLAGHSDADVLAHALIDALLGAAGLGDIGLHFPPHDGRWEGATGARLLSLTMGLVESGNFVLENADLTLIGERPRLAGRRQAMAAAMAEALGVPEGLLNLKGKTTEGLGFIGRREGLAAAATVLLSSAG